MLLSLDLFDLIVLSGEMMEVSDTCLAPVHASLWNTSQQQASLVHGRSREDRNLSKPIPKCPQSHGKEQDIMENLSRDQSPSSGPPCKGTAPLEVNRPLKPGRKIWIGCCWLPGKSLWGQEHHVDTGQLKL